MMTKYGTQLKLHKPVLTDEVCDLLGLGSAHLKSKARLKVKPEGKTRTFVDATVGMGGHSVKIVESGNYLLGIDADDWSLEYAKKRLQEACPPLLDKDKSILYKLVKSENIWEKRISILATFTFIRNNQFDDTLKLSEILINDKHDLIHKAVGWMLRELGKRDQKIEEYFLNKHYKKLPRTMLRYAIEKFPESQRQSYLKR